MIDIIDNCADVLLWITFLVNLFLVVLILSKRPRKKVNVVFGLLVLSIAFWNLTRMMTDISFFNQRVDVLMWTRLALVGPIFIAYLFLIFSFLFLAKKADSNWKRSVAFIVPSLALLAFIFTDYNASQATVLDSGKLSWAPGPLYYWFTVYFLLYVIWAVVILFRKFKRSNNRIQKLQIKVIFISALFASILGILASAVLPLFGNLCIYDYAVPITAIFTVAVTYVILRYRFLDIRLIFKKGLVYSLLLIIILGIVSFSVILLGGFFQSFFQFSYILTATICAFLIALIFHPLRAFLYKWINNIYYKRKTIQDTRREVTRAIKKNADLPKALAGIAGIVQKDLRINDVNFLIFDAREKKYKTEFSNENKNIEINATEYFISVIKRENKIFVKDEVSLQKEDVENEEERDHLDKVEKKLGEVNMELVMPLIAAEELVAVFFLGNKKNNKAYSVEDIKYLNEITEQASYLIGNILLYKYAMERVLGRGQA